MIELRWAFPSGKLQYRTRMPYMENIIGAYTLAYGDWSEWVEVPQESVGELGKQIAEKFSLEVLLDNARNILNASNNVSYPSPYSARRIRAILRDLLDIVEREKK